MQEEGSAMNLDIRSVHMPLADDTRQYLEKKLRHRLRHLSDRIVDLRVTLTADHGSILFGANLHLRWGHDLHVEIESYDEHEGIDLLIDKLESAATKDKVRVQEKRPKR